LCTSLLQRARATHPFEINHKEPVNSIILSITMSSVWSLCVAAALMVTINADSTGCVWDGTGCFDDGCDPDQRASNCAKFGAQDSCESQNGKDSRCRWSFGEAAGAKAAKPASKKSERLVRPNDQINLEPMRGCTECWECYACTHDEHYGTVGNCVPILGCIPSECTSDSQCGSGRSCMNGACKNEACSVTADCDGDRKCYYGECRDPCTHSSDCQENASGDICEHGLCVCSGSMC
jgi:Cys-rich repeat protein